MWGWGWCEGGVCVRMGTALGTRGLHGPLTGDHDIRLPLLVPPRTPPPHPPHDDVAAEHSPEPLSRDGRVVLQGIRRPPRAIGHRGHTDQPDSRSSGRRDPCRHPRGARSHPPHLPYPPHPTHGVDSAVDERRRGLDHLCHPRGERRRNCRILGCRHSCHQQPLEGRHRPLSGGDGYMLRYAYALLVFDDWMRGG